MINFDNDENLGKMIAKKQLYTFGAEPVTQFKELVFAAGGNKFSSLCGFRFTSNAPVEYKDFFIAFVCKLRSKIYRQADANPSQWFILKKISGKEIHCMDKSSILMQYNFDVDKFFESDYFQKTVSAFKTKILKGLDTYVPEYVKAHGAEKAKDLLTSYDGDKPDTTVQDAYKRYSDAIKASLEYIDSTRCNDKFYKLIDYDIKVEKEEADVNEDDLVSEDTCECIVKQEEDGKFSVCEKEDNAWIAAFANETAANDFANNYPQMKTKYTKAAQESDTKKEMLEKEVDPSDKELAEKETDPTDEEITEKELDNQIEEALKDIYK